MAIPYTIKRKAASILKAYPEAQLVHLGQYKGEEAFCIQMPDDAITGYPPVYLLRNGKAVEIFGEEVFEVLRSFPEAN